MRKPLESIENFKQRRHNLISKLGAFALVLPAHPETIRNGSVHNPYRADSNMYYLTGFEEPESVLVITPYLDKKVTLFVRKKDPLRETWDGFRYGPEGVIEHFGIDQAFPIEELEHHLSILLTEAEGVFYRFHRDEKMDRIFLETLNQVRLKKGRTGLGYLPIQDSFELLGEMRVIKSEIEIQNQRMAGQISSRAHNNIMKEVRHLKNERQVHGRFIYEIMNQGLAREGYGTIVAGGANACTLHYVFNDQPLKAGQLLLIDAGGEYHYQTADITRTYPVTGEWSKEQLIVYQGVLSVQQQVIGMIKPGVLWSNIQEQGSKLLIELMLELGLLSGRAQDIFATQEFRTYYPHGIGHYLGLDVHDAGLYIKKDSKSSRVLEPGMILTVEPGLYIPSQDSSHLRGIGIRIEDNILVTEQGFENLTLECLKDPEQITKQIQGS